MHIKIKQTLPNACGLDPAHIFTMRPCERNIVGNMKHWIVREMVPRTAEGGNMLLYLNDRGTLGDVEKWRSWNWILSTNKRNASSAQPYLRL